MTTMRATTVDVPGHTPTYAAEKFWPHVSIAYSNTAQPAALVVTRVEALRQLAPAEVLITSVALVKLGREGRAYRWEVLERVGLCG